MKYFLSIIITLCLLCTGCQFLQSTDQGQEKSLLSTNEALIIQSTIQMGIIQTQNSLIMKNLTSNPNNPTSISTQLTQQLAVEQTPTMMQLIPSLEPSMTPSPVSSPTNPDTSSEILLEVGQSARKNNFLLILDEIVLNPKPTHPSKCTLGIKFHIENWSSLSTIVSVRGSQFSLVDNLNNRWENQGFDIASNCPAHNFPESQVVDPGKKFPTYGYSNFTVGFAGNITDPAVDYVIVTVNDLLQFNDVKWKIQINN